MPNQNFDKVRKFYNVEYYGRSRAKHEKLPWHYRFIARRLGDLEKSRILDIACGTGGWLQFLKSRGAKVSGIDISDKAIDACRIKMPDDEFHVSVAEELPLPDASFNLITCLGSLEHFLDKPAALREMLRVAKPGAKFLLLVPNAGFLTRRLGLFKGTQQTQIREDVWPLHEWSKMFHAAGLKVAHRWRDLHMLSKDWICRGPAYRWPLRALQAVALPFWPICWQYQVYHLCVFDVASRD